MFKSLTMALFLSFTLGCAGTKTAPIAAAEKNYFSDIQGCFLLYNVKTGAFDKVINAEICKERFPACSTFKVPLAVMAFDAKILKDENKVKVDTARKLLSLSPKQKTTASADSKTEKKNAVDEFFQDK